MHLTTALDCVASVPTPEQFAHFAQDVAPAWIEEALTGTGTATLRRRRLPVEQVVWIVIGMALLRDRPITEVVNKLNLAMPSPTRPTVAPSAVPPARDRLGESPMAWLFARSADHWAHQSAARDRWRGLALYGVDGTTMRVPDTEENRAHFGLADGGHRGPSGYPLVRLVALMALRSHLLAAASFGPSQGHGEYWYAEDLWSCLPDNALVIVDRNFWAAPVLIPLQRDGSNRHWLIRAKSNVKGRPIKRLGPRDELVEMKVCAQARAKDASLPKTWVVRVIHYQLKGFQPQRLITSLLDPVAYPAAELVALYHERWEIGASCEGRMNQSVKVRPGSKDSKPRSSGGAVAREQDGEALRQQTSKGGCATHQVAAQANAEVASLHANPVAETVDNARRQQIPPKTSQMRRYPPAGYQRRHGAKVHAETGEALGARRRNLAEEARPITVSGKWPGRHQGGGSGRSTEDPRATQRAGKEGPGPMDIPIGNERQG